MPSSAVTKNRQHGAIAESRDGILEETEHSAKASASAGLNLNLVGALSGALFSKSNKTTEADGSSIETREDNVLVNGAGAGNLNAAASADAEEKGRQMRKAIRENNASAS